MSSSAENAREQARKKDGKFGEQPHDRADGIDLDTEEAWEFHPSPVQQKTGDARSTIADIENEKALIQLGRQIQHQHPGATHVVLSRYDEDGYVGIDAHVYGGYWYGDRVMSQGDCDAVDQLSVGYRDACDTFPVDECDYNDPKIEPMMYTESNSLVAIFKVDDLVGHRIDPATVRDRQLRARRELEAALAALDQEIGA